MHSLSMDLSDWNKRRCRPCFLHVFRWIVLSVPCTLYHTHMVWFRSPDKFSPKSSFPFLSWTPHNVADTLLILYIVHCSLKGRQCSQPGSSLPLPCLRFRIHSFVKIRCNIANLPESFLWNFVSWLRATKCLGPSNLEKNCVILLWLMA
jgi:hypothetical protein